MDILTLSRRGGDVHWGSKVKGYLHFSRLKKVNLFKICMDGGGGLKVGAGAYSGRVHGQPLTLGLSKRK